MAYADCTESQMMAMFGWTDPKMRRVVILGRKLGHFNAKRGFMGRAEGGEDGSNINSLPGWAKRKVHVAPIGAFQAPASKLN